MGKGAQRTGGKRLVRTGRGVRRGQSELVGIVLLFGMVAFGALLVFAAGGTMLALASTLSFAVAESWSERRTGPASR